MKYYIATGYKNAARHAVYNNQLQAMGHHLTADWTTMPARADAIGLAAAGDFDIKGVLDADFVVVILPGAQGTHTELGAAIASGKKVFVVADTIPADIAFARAMETCPFYFCTGVTRCSDFYSFNQAIRLWLAEPT